MTLLAADQVPELGVARMDDTHKEFAEQLNALAEAADADMLALLDRFIVHTVEHFDQENRWMGAMTFPPAHCHVNEHEGVLGIMRDVRRMVADEGKYDIGRVLVRELAPWFANHAASMDAMLAYVIRQTGFDTMQALPAVRPEDFGICAPGESLCQHQPAQDAQPDAQPEPAQKV